jgi:hypothetical protein
MQNYTNPETYNETQDPKNLLNATLIFARTISLLFEEGYGIVVDVVGDVNLDDDTKKVIVYTHEGQVRIDKCEEDLAEGTNIKMSFTEEEVKNEN